MTTQQVSDGVYRVRDGLVNCYLLEEDGEMTLVDAAWPRSWKHLQQALSGIGKTGSVRAVLLSHGHADHLGCAEKARRSWRVPVLAHEDEVGRVTGTAKGSSPFNLVPELLPYIWRPKTFGFVAHASARGFLTPRWVKVVTSFSSGTELEIPGHPRVVLTPGHTEGHSSFYLPQAGAFLSGDAMATLDPLTRERGPRLLPDPLNGDNAQARASVERLAGIEADLLLPGHGEPYHGSLSGAVETALAT